MNEILETVIRVCKEVFDNEDMELTAESCSSDFEEWDSLTFLNIISDLEDEFGIGFSLDEITDSKNLGQLAAAIEKHLKEK